MAEPPNIVFILLDNVGWGDFGCYGGMTPTPRIDKFASEGIRFNSYYVEAQCTPTRSGILTGRFSVRSGTYTVPWPGEGPGGLSPWEYTLPQTPVRCGVCHGALRQMALRQRRGASARMTSASTSGGGSRTPGMRLATRPIRFSKNLVRSRR